MAQCKCGCKTLENKEYARGHWIRVNNPMNNEKSRMKAGNSWRGKTQPKSLVENRVSKIIGRTQTNETKKAISNSLLGTTQSIETRLKRSLSMKGKNIGELNGSKKKSVRQQLREIRTSQLLKAGSTANYNPKACEFFDKLNNELGLSGQHALNDGEKIVKGYWLDYYEPNLNLAIEWDEKHHYKNGKLREKDLVKQNIVQKELNCSFLRINEQTGEIR